MDFDETNDSTVWLSVAQLENPGLTVFPRGVCVCVRHDANGNRSVLLKLRDIICCCFSEHTGMTPTILHKCCISLVCVQ